MNALIGKKIGMTRVFDGQGRQVPVTVLQAGPCVVVQRRTRERDGYEAVQVGFDPQKASRLTKAAAGHFAKAGVDPVRVLRELPLAEGENAQPGEVITVKAFEGVTHVDITGVSKGRGFQGVIRRHHMSGQPMAHGHTMHRRPGSVGMREEPGRILKNKRMPGHLGHVTVTTQNIEVVQVRPDDHLLLVRGSVPGPVGGTVEIRKAVKKG